MCITLHVSFARSRDEVFDPQPYLQLTPSSPCSVITKRLHRLLSLLFRLLHNPTHPLEVLTSRIPQQLKQHALARRHRRAFTPQSLYRNGSLTSVTAAHAVLDDIYFVVPWPAGPAPSASRRCAFRCRRSALLWASAYSFAGSMMWRIFAGRGGGIVGRGPSV